MSLLASLGLASILLVALFTWISYQDNVSNGSRQSRRQAIIEVWISIGIGFALNFLLNLVLLPLVGAKFTLMDNLWLGCIYTLASVMRGYAIRRWADERIHRLAEKLAQE
jgi:hypothetical protein